MKHASLLLIILWIGLLIVQQLNHPQIRLNPISSRLFHPLDTRLHYQIGEVDPRFQVSTVEIQQLAEQAAQIWQQGTGRDLLVYDPHARLKINLIYDQRQENTVQRLNDLKEIKKNQQQQNNQQQQIDQHKTEILRLQQQIEFKQRVFEAESTQYNHLVATLNERGGVTPQLKQQFDQEKLRLDELKTDLNQSIEQYNAVVDQSNAQVQHYNQVRQNVEQSIQDYNQHYAARPFDKGLFNGKAINIYEFENQQDLRLVIAHEFGHALGLAHTQNNSHALMYPVLKDQNMQNFQLTTDDLQLLQDNSIWNKIFK